SLRDVVDPSLHDQHVRPARAIFQPRGDLVGALPVDSAIPDLEPALAHPDVPPAQAGRPLGDRITERGDDYRRLRHRAIIDVEAGQWRDVPPDQHTTGHDIVVVGASAGGVEALRTICARLPGDLPAAVFVVLHVPAIATSVLPAILQRAGDLPAAHAVDGAEIERGRIYIAPPDHHLLIQPGFMRV